MVLLRYYKQHVSSASQFKKILGKVVLQALYNAQADSFLSPPICFNTVCNLSVVKYYNKGVKVMMNNTDIFGHELHE